MINKVTHLFFVPLHPLSSYGEMIKAK